MTNFAEIWFVEEIWELKDTSYINLDFRITVIHFKHTNTLYLAGEGFWNCYLLSRTYQKFTIRWEEYSNTRVLLVESVSLMIFILPFQRFAESCILSIWHHQAWLSFSWRHNTKIQRKPKKIWRHNQNS